MRHTNTKKRCQAIAALRAAGIDAIDMTNAELYALMRLAGYRWRDTDNGYRWLMVKESEVMT